MGVIEQIHGPAAWRNEGDGAIALQRLERKGREREKETWVRGGCRSQLHKGPLWDDKNINVSRVPDKTITEVKIMLKAGSDGREIGELKEAVQILSRAMADLTYP